MVTGSHNPPDYNGLKMVIDGSTLSGPDIQALRARIERADVATGAGGYREHDVATAYLDRIAACAAELSGALDLFAAHAERLPPDQAGPAAAAWRALAAVARTGDPANMATALTAAGGAVDALVGDVLAGYAAELE